MRRRRSSGVKCAWVQGQPPLPRDLGLTVTSLSLSLFFCQVGMTVPFLPTGMGWRVAARWEDGGGIWCGVMDRCIWLLALA